MIADCVLLRDTNSRRSTDLDEAGRQLAAVQIATVTVSPGLTDFEGNFDLAEAQLALLRGQMEAANRYAEKAEPLLTEPGADPYERTALASVRTSIYRNSGRVTH